MTIDLLEWYRSLPSPLPERKEGARKRYPLRRGELTVPSELSSRALRACGGWRRPGGLAIQIDSVFVHAPRSALRAFGLALIAFVLSGSKRRMSLLSHRDSGAPFRIDVEPGRPTQDEACLGMASIPTRYTHRPWLPKDNPNYWTFEQDDESYPDDQLPCWSLHREPSLLPTSATGAELSGSWQAIAWMGRYLHNLGLEDCNATMSYLYNEIPGRSLHAGSAEFRWWIEDEPLAPLRAGT